MNSYQNLPGVEVRIKDGGLILPEEGFTESVLVIAPSINADAPGEPVRVRDSNELEKYGFGPFTKAGSVNIAAVAWKAAFEGGAREIYLMALKGETKEERFRFLKDATEGFLADFTANHVVVMGLDSLNMEGKASDEGHGVINSFLLEDVELSLTLPAQEIKALNLVIDNGSGQKVEEKIVFESKEYTTKEEVRQELERALKELKLHGLAATSLRLDGEDENTRVFFNITSNVSFEAGFDSKEKAKAANKLNAAKLLGQYAESQTLNLERTIAYIAAPASEDFTLSGVNKYVKEQLTQIENEFSGYVQVVAIEAGYNVPGLIKPFYMNGAVTYAALASRIRPESATTNKEVSGIVAIRPKYSLRQLDTLAGKKFVTFKYRGGRAYVTDGCTTAPDIVVGDKLVRSDFARLSTLRVTQMAAEVVRGACEPYIGEPNQMPEYNALNASIKSELEAMKDAGALIDYRFTIVTKSLDLTHAVVTLELVPAFELRKITVDVTLDVPKEILS